MDKVADGLKPGIKIMKCLDGREDIQGFLSWPLQADIYIPPLTQGDV